MANVEITTAANWIPEIWSTLVLEDLHKNLVLANLQDHRYDEFNVEGDRIQVPGLAEISATVESRAQPASSGDWSESAITFSANTETQTTIEIDRRAYAAVLVDDPVNIQANLPVMQLYTMEIGRAVAQQIDTDIGTTMATTSNTKGTDNQAITDQDIRDSRQVIDEGNGEMQERFIAVSPASFMDLLNIDQYVNSLYMASLNNFDASKGRGFVGRIYEFDVYETTNLPAGTAGTKNFVWQREAHAYVNPRDVDVTMREPHDQFASAIRAVAYYGRKIMRGALIVQLNGR